MIVYALRVRGIPLRWMTRIERWNPPFEFIDIQTKGPYKVLQNTHRFLEVEGGTLIAETGRVRSAIRNAGPPGPPMQVAQDLSRIFDYQEQKVRDCSPDLVGPRDTECGHRPK